MGGSDPKTFEVAESSPLRVLWIVLPLLAAFVACVYAQLYKAPASAPWIEVALSPPWFRMGGSAAWSLLVIAVLGIGLGAAFFRRRVELDDNVLDVRSTMYRRRVPVAQLRLDQAEVVDLQRDRRYGIRVKTNGYSVPGFYSGHFRLHGGGKASLWSPIVRVSSPCRSVTAARCCSAWTGRRRCSMRCTKWPRRRHGSKLLRCNDAPPC